MNPADVSVVVCTLNSISGIEACLESLRASGAATIIVVDAGSTDGTREVAMRLADRLLDDPGIGLGNARNIGIAETTSALVLNMGSDNVMPPGELQRMIDTLEAGGYAGVSARTRIQGSGYFAFGLNVWRDGRFRVGPAAVIGTPTLFRGDLIRSHPYDSDARFSDDSELCERWRRTLGARFAISEAYVTEVGKTSWEEVRVRCRMYGISDEEVFRRGRSGGWSLGRQIRSLTHPIRVDLADPLLRVPPSEGIKASPFLVAFTALRYAAWVKRAWGRSRS